MREEHPDVPRLTLRGVNKTFTRKRKPPLEALSDINMEIPTGEFAVIVGPSGCGKSTLLNIIAGLDYADNGEILIDGTRPVFAPGADRGMVFQNYTLSPWLSVRKNIEFGPHVGGVDKTTRQHLAEHYIELVGLRGFEDALPKTLSGGMKQRVAIARTLANEPMILLMDEPFGALDAQTRIVMQELLVEIWGKERTTVVFITHDIDEALLLGTKVYVMSRRPGKIVASFSVKLGERRDHTMLVAPAFLELKKQIMELLWEESLAAARA